METWDDERPYFFGGRIQPAIGESSFSRPSGVFEESCYGNISKSLKHVLEIKVGLLILTEGLRDVKEVSNLGIFIGYH